MAELKGQWVPGATQHWVGQDPSQNRAWNPATGQAENFYYDAPEPAPTEQVSNPNNVGTGTGIVPPWGLDNPPQADQPSAPMAGLAQAAPPPPATPPPQAAAPPQVDAGSSYASRVDQSKSQAGAISYLGQPTINVATPPSTTSPGGNPATPAPPAGTPAPAAGGAFGAPPAYTGAPSEPVAGLQTAMSEGQADPSVSFQDAIQGLRAGIGNRAPTQLSANFAPGRQIY